MSKIKRERGVSRSCPTESDCEEAPSILYVYKIKLTRKKVKSHTTLPFSYQFMLRNNN